MKKVLVMAFVICAPFAHASACIYDAWHKLFDGCITIEEPVALDFQALKNVSNEWYTPFSTHSLWKDNYCGTTSYLSLENESTPGLEHQYYLKKSQLSSEYELPKTEWHKIVNSFVTSKSVQGVSFWTAKLKIDVLDVWFTAPETKSYAIIVDPSENPKWWAAFYCSSTDGGVFTRGFDIRSSYLPLEPEVVEQIKAAALAKGVPQHELDKLYETPYSGCRVNDSQGVSYIYP